MPYHSHWDSMTYRLPLAEERRVARTMLDRHIAEYAGYLRRATELDAHIVSCKDTLVKLDVASQYVGPLLQVAAAVYQGDLARTISNARREVVDIRDRLAPVARRRRDRSARALDRLYSGAA